MRRRCCWGGHWGARLNGFENDIIFGHKKMQSMIQREAKVFKKENVLMVEKNSINQHSTLGTSGRESLPMGCFLWESRWKWSLLSEFMNPTPRKYSFHFVISCSISFPPSSYSLPYQHLLSQHFDHSRGTRKREFINFFFVRVLPPPTLVVVVDGKRIGSQFWLELETTTFGGHFAFASRLRASGARQQNIRS